MPLPRFFVDLPSESLAGTVLLPPGAARHAGLALRLAEGDAVALFNGSGLLWTGRITFSGKSAAVEVRACSRPPMESPLRMTLVQSLVSPEKLDWIVEKSVEAGVAAVVLAPSARSVTRLSGERLEKRLAKLTETARSAAEQCGRCVVPPVSACATLAEALRTVEAEDRIMLAPSAQKSQPPRAEISSVAFAVGPEGGFSPEEMTLAQNLGWRLQTLGPRVFRTETAGLAFAVYANTLRGDLVG